MSEKKFELVIKRTWGKYKIENNCVSQQSSYNLPKELFDYLMEKNMLIFYKNRNDKNIVYKLLESYKFVLDDSIISMIGNEYKDKKNSFFCETTVASDGTKKQLLSKKMYKDENEEGEWFEKLYSNNIIGNTLNFFIDTENKILKLELIWTSLNEETDYTDYDSELDMSVEEEEEEAFLDDDISHQKIIYGAPGTGKSYYLSEEVKVNFPNKSIEFLSPENNENVWLVGANWDGIQKYDEFRDENKWINGYDSGNDFNRAKRMSIGDYIIIKTSYFTGGVGDKIPTLELRAIGKIKKIKTIGKEVLVEWIKKDLSEKLIHENYRATVHDITKKSDLVNKIFNNTALFDKKEEQIISSQRVTFYDGYTYGQFVGSYKPVMYESDTSEREIGYDYISGPLLKQILNAYKHPSIKFILIIEEINRAKPDRVFGDIFQLLDRNSNGDSEYPISLSCEQENYFKENLDGETYFKTILEKGGLYLPNNLYIWATMNSADQGVYPMDTAFKRRWDFEYIPLDKNNNSAYLTITINNEKYDWNGYRKVLNDVLGEHGITEDRLIAPYFLKDTDFDENNNLKKESYINKFLMYLFDDILKHNNRLKEYIFAKNQENEGKNLNFYKIYSKIESDEQIYSTDFIDRLEEHKEIPKIDVQSEV